MKSKSGNASKTLKNIGIYIKTLLELLPRKAVIGLGVALVAILSAAVLFSGGKGGASSPEKLLDKYIAAYQKADNAAILDLVYDPVVECAFNIEGQRYTEEKFLRSIDSLYSQYGSKISNWKIESTATYDEDAMESVNEILEIRWDMAEMDPIEARDTEFLTVRASHENGGSWLKKFLVMKFESRWYLYSVMDMN